MSNNGFSDRVLRNINWVGVVAGVLMIVLPFMGSWWNFVVGDNVLKIAFSPFYYEVSFIGEILTSPIVDYLIIGAQLTVLIGGIFMIIGSLRATTWWGEKLLKWGGLKIVWMLVFLIIVVIIAALIANRFLPSIISGMIEGDLTVDLSLPYIVGTGYGEFWVENAVKITAPVRLSLTSSFWLAVVTTVLGIGARFYQSRKIEVAEEEEKDISGPEASLEEDSEELEESDSPDSQKSGSETE